MSLPRFHKLLVPYVGHLGERLVCLVKISNVSDVLKTLSGVCRMFCSEVPCC